MDRWGGNVGVDVDLSLQALGARATTSGSSFVGRSTELAVLRTAFELARQGHPQVVLVEGAGGYGKTSLVRHFVSQLDGATCLWASGHEAETSLSYGVVRQLIGAGAALAQRPAPRVGGEAGRLTPPWSVGAELVELAGELQATSPVVIVVDDMHWADAGSVQALVFALRRLYAEGALTILCAESGAIPEGLERVVRDRGRRLVVAGLSTGEVRDLGRAQGVALSGRAARRLRDHADGSPLYVTMLLRELADDVLAAHPDVPLPVPRSFATLVVSRLANCSHEAEQLVVAAAVLASRRGSISSRCWVGSASRSPLSTRRWTRVCWSSGIWRAMWSSSPTP